MSDFYPGQYVLCVDADGIPPEGEKITEGHVYTIRSVFTGLSGEAGVRLEERINKIHPVGHECGYLLRRFRPLKDSALDVFRAHLAPAPKQKEPAQ